MNIQDTIKQRYSVRFYQKDLITEETRAALLARLDTVQSGPFGSPVRFSLVAAAEQDSASLKGLGTYGFIKDPTGFIIGAVQAGDHALEDYGYAMEQAILDATELGLGTCWLGGTFTQSSFAAKIGKRSDEIIPAVTSTGYADPNSRTNDRTRQQAHADQRLPWEALFFDGSFERPLSERPLSERPSSSANSAGNVNGYAQPLEMVRIGPSASNKQPWRVVRDGSAWHFYCQRTPGYGKGSWMFNVMRLADLQRLDVGIAMCHFELTARELGLNGAWKASDPGLAPIDDKTLYIATWEGA